MHADINLSIVRELILKFIKERFKLILLPCYCISIFTTWIIDYSKTSYAYKKVQNAISVKSLHANVSKSSVHGTVQLKCRNNDVVTTELFHRPTICVCMISEVELGIRRDTPYRSHAPHRVSIDHVEETSTNRGIDLFDIPYTSDQRLPCPRKGSGYANAVICIRSPRYSSILVARDRTCVLANRRCIS